MTISAALLIPETMRAVQGRNYGPIDEMLTVEEGVTVPRPSSPLNPRRYRDQMLIRTEAVALAPGDCRVLSGKTRELQGPPAFPYIPGGDACGVVVELPPSAGKTKVPLPFNVGDRVAVRFCDKNYDAAAEFALVSTKVAVRVPETISSVDAAALASAAPAQILATYASPGDRVLVLGAGGGVGAHLCQLLRVRGASYVVGVGSSPINRLCQSPISCDDAIDYTTTDPYIIQKYVEKPFDLIFDLAGGGYTQLEQQQRQRQAVLGPEPPSMIIKPTGHFVTTVPPAGPIFEIRSLWALLQIFVWPILWRTIKSRVRWLGGGLPKYTFAFALTEDRQHLTDLLKLAHERRVQAVVDPHGPFPFTTEGVRKAFHRQESRHANGKVVIRVA